MRCILQAMTIAVAVGAAQRLAAIDYAISGDQTVYNIDGVKTSALMSVSFTLTRAGTNWAIINTYTNNTGVIDTIAMVSGCTYSVTTDLSGKGSGAGLVMDNAIDRLEGATIFPRVLLMAFLTPQQSLANLTNTPVPFLGPRHAALHCYKWSFRWSAQGPYLPEQVRFDLDPVLVRQVSAEAISYCFRSGYRDRSLFKAFAASQRSGAEYSVTAWTNWNGQTLPLRSTFRFTTFDIINKELVLPQLVVVTVTNIAVAGSGSLIPALTPGDGVQHVYNRTCYYYTSTDGGFLSHEQAKAVGRVLTPAPPPPRLWAVAVLLRSFPWRSALPILFAVALLTVGTVVWLVARFLLSRK